MTEKKQKKKLRKTTIFLIVVLSIYLVIGLITAGGYTYFMQGAPKMNLIDYVGEEGTKIYDSNDNLITEIGLYQRNNVKYTDLPECLIDAFLATEDSRYFKHRGFDAPRMIQSLIDNIRSSSFRSGGSTFTMQLVKNTYFTIDAGEDSVEREKTISYKVQQISIALQTERILSKKEIFALYINRLNFGANIRGIQRASEYYFAKDCQNLNVAESALLAGIINLPNTYNPYRYLDYATQRRDTVLRLMLSHGYISQDEYNLYSSIKVEDMLAGENNYRMQNYDSSYQFYIDQVIQEAMKITGEDPYYVSMEIHTAMSRNLQDAIYAIQNGNSEVHFPDDAMQSAIACLDNTNGEIVGLGGGKNADGSMLLNRATQMYKQPGSSIKPVLSYALGFEYLGYSLDEILEDKPVTYNNRTLVNSTGSYWGRVNIRDALAYSLNMPSVITLQKVIDTIGEEAVVQYLQNLGFSQVTSESFGLLYAIGGNECVASPLEMAVAHATMINHGTYQEPHCIRSIKRKKEGIVNPEIQTRQVLSSGSAYLVDVLMENNVSCGLNNSMDILQRPYPVYAKTGTTDWGRDGLQYGYPVAASKDKWMIASTSKYTNAVWVGYDQASSDVQAWFDNAKTAANLPGNINNLLLGYEETMSDEVSHGVQRPADVVDITYTYQTYPHRNLGYNLITSQVSQSGLDHVPLQ